jgi:hypothetical protein
MSSIDEQERERMHSLARHPTSAAYRISRHVLGLTLCALLIAATAHAQTANPTSKLLWEQGNTSTPADALALIYRDYLDAATTGAILTPTGCVVTSGQTTTSTCTAPFPPMTVGAHAISITASTSQSGSESTRSNVVTFTLVIVPATPTNLRIAKLFGLNALHLSSTRGLLHWRRSPMVGFIVAPHPGT